jgi:hypothetical protein
MVVAEIDEVAAMGMQHSSGRACPSADGTTIATSLSDGTDGSHGTWRTKS